MSSYPGKAPPNRKVLVTVTESGADFEMSPSDFKDLVAHCERDAKLPQPDATAAAPAPKLKLKQCRFVAFGTCKNGEACPFLHEKCIFYQKGNCARQHFCMYIHEPSTPPSQKKQNAAASATAAAAAMTDVGNDDDLYEKDEEGNVVGMALPIDTDESDAFVIAPVPPITPAPVLMPVPRLHPHHNFFFGQRGRGRGHRHHNQQIVSSHSPQQLVATGAVTAAAGVPLAVPR